MSPQQVGPLRYFEDLTIELMMHKYIYYELNSNLISDWDYDQMEKKWYKMGTELGLLAEDETSPCVGFDEKHPMAEKARERVDKSFHIHSKGDSK